MCTATGMPNVRELFRVQIWCISQFVRCTAEQLHVFWNEIITRCLLPLNCGTYFVCLLQLREEALPGRSVSSGLPHRNVQIEITEDDCERECGLTLLAR